MHKILYQGAWKAEYLRDDSDFYESIKNELAGCSNIKYIRKNNDYLAEIRFEEQNRNSLIYIEAIVLNNKNKDSNEAIKYSLEDMVYFERNVFQGDSCKKRAAEYSIFIKREIDSSFFEQKTS